MGPIGAIFRWFVYATDGVPTVDKAIKYTRRYSRYTTTCVFIKQRCFLPGSASRCLFGLRYSKEGPLRPFKYTSLLLRRDKSVTIGGL